MLPHFPKAHKEMTEWRNSLMFDALFAASPMLAEIGIRAQREGKDSSFQDESGVIRKIGYQLKRVEVKQSVKEARGMSLKEFIENAQQPGKEMGHLMMRDLFKVMEKTTKQTGNVVNAKGKPISFDLLLECLEKVEIDFDSDGKARFPTLMLHPKAFASVKEKMTEWDSDPTCQKRLEDVIRRKREGFRAREARRRLVD